MSDLVTGQPVTSTGATSPPLATRIERSLWGHRDFLRLWAGQTVALFGEQVTLLALPLTAILVLGATPGQLGALNAVQYLPIAFVTLLAGVLADRTRRRPLLIAANIGRALTLAAVPVFFALGELTMGLLYAVAFVAGTFTAQFDVAYQSYLPALVPGRQLIEANSKLQSSQSIAHAAGLGASGVLIQVLTAPVAILVNSIGYLVSVAALLGIRTPEPRPVTQSRSIRNELGEGLSIVWSDPLLRAVMLQSAWFNLFWDIVLVLIPFYAVNILHLSAALLGGVIALGSVGAFAGSLVAARLGRRLGTGRAMGLGMVIACAALLLLPLPAGSGIVTVLLLVIAYLVNGFGMTIFNIHSMTLRQSRVPGALLGRVSATYRCLSFVIIPIGGITAGALAATIGPRNTLAVAGLALLSGAVIFATCRTVRCFQTGNEPGGHP